MTIIKKLRTEKDWTQYDLADHVNAILEANPELKKITAKNEDGLSDQKTIQRIEAGKIDLDIRWIRILSLVFEVTPFEIAPDLLAGDEWLQKRVSKLAQLSDVGREVVDSTVNFDFPDKFLKKD